MGVTKLNSIKLGDMEAYYVLDEEKQAVELMLLPEGMQEPEWLSGDVTHLSDEQWAVIDQGIQFYKKAAPIIKNGVSHMGGYFA